MDNILTRLYHRIPAKPFVFGYLALYVLTLMTLVRFEGVDPSEPLLVFGVLGVGITALAWCMTRRSSLATVPMPVKPLPEALAVAGYLLLYAFGLLGWGFTWLRDNVPDPRYYVLMVMLAKLLTMVALPLLLLEHFGHSPRALLRWNFSLRRHGVTLVVMVTTLLLFQAAFGGGISQIRELNPSLPVLLAAVPLCFLYLCLDTGLTEEFLFRVVVQTRLAALFRSETAGVVVMAVLFGLAHAPGYYLRAVDPHVGTHPSVLMAAGYTVVMLSAFGLMFGMLWARTRSLGLVIMAHAATDLLPNLPDFLSAWT